MKKLIFPVLLMISLSGCSYVEKSKEIKSVNSTSTNPNVIVNNDLDKKTADLFVTTKIPENGLREGGVYKNYEYKFEFEYPKNVILINRELNTDEKPVLQLSIIKDYDLKTKEAEDKAINDIVDAENKKLEETYGENNFMPIMGQLGEFVNINNNELYLVKSAGEGFFGVGQQAYIQIGKDVLLLNYLADNEYFEKVAAENKKNTSWSYDVGRALLNNEIDVILQSFKFINN